MTGRTRIAALLGTICAALALPAAAQDAFNLKPGAKGKLCLECHVTFEETMQLPHVHTPVEAGDCSDCHNPHASSHGKFLSASPNEICFSCHEGLVPEDRASAHDAAVAGECVSCHDPHASKNPNNLLQAGNELCNGCHEELATVIANSQFKHYPVKKNCLTCHTPHASESFEFLLKNDANALCSSKCHDPTRPAFIEQHMNYPVGESRCTSCHDPHGSNTRGMLWATAHRPVLNKMCDQCHLGTDAANPLATQAQGAELCQGCHAGMLRQVFDEERIHWPLVAAGACLNCHGPHATREAGLLLDEPKVVCGACHADTIARQDHSEAKHAPVDEGECVACHDPHSSDHPLLLTRENSVELCGDCHDWQQHSSHPIGEELADRRNPNLAMNCLSCHFSHGSEFAYLTPLDPSSALCVDCHEEFRR